MNCKTILILSILLSLSYSFNPAAQLNQLTTKEFAGKAGQTLVTNAFKDYNTEKRQRTFLEKNIRSITSQTGQTGKNLEMISEIGESGVHYAIDKSIPIMNKITKLTQSTIKSFVDSTVDSTVDPTTEPTAESITQFTNSENHKNM